MSQDNIILPQYELVNVPIELIQFVHKNELVKPFAIYLYLKMHCSGQVMDNSPLFKQARQQLRCRTDKTFKKHFKKLMDLNWIGFNGKSGRVFIRGFDFLRFQNHFRNPNRVEFQMKDFQSLPYFISSSIIGKHLNHQQYAKSKRERSKHKQSKTKASQKTEGLKRITSFQPEACYLNYEGISRNRLGSILNCSPSNGGKHKQAGAINGYLEYIKRYAPFHVMSATDFNLRNIYHDVSLHLARRIRVMKVKIDGALHYDFRIQLHDEIKCLLTFKRGKRYKHLRLSPVLQEQHRRQILSDKEAMKKKRKEARAKWDTEANAAFNKVSAIYRS